MRHAPCGHSWLWGPPCPWCWPSRRPGPDHHRIHRSQWPPAGLQLCFQCHGTNGKGPGFDRLAGKSASSLYSDLKEFQAGQEGNGIMAKHALGYTDAQLQALAQWLSTQR